jgi:hypothetical protein
MLFVRIGVEEKDIVYRQRQFEKRGCPTVRREEKNRRKLALKKSMKDSNRSN